MSELLYFNILIEAKARALVVMTKKYHPEYSKEEIEDHLKRLIGYAVEKELGEGVKER
jgi:hypothetical protein